MIIMKRILTLFLALCLSVSCLVLPAYGAETAEGEQAQPKIELGIRMSEIDMLLKALGILDSSFDLTETSNVTLAEFAEGAARLMKLSYNADTPAFSDSADFAGINCIAAAGYIEADPNVVCMPTAAITTLDAVKILLRALGCGNLVDYYENDAATLLAFAKKIELVESVDMQAKLSRVNMAELLYNALIAEFDSTTMVVGDVTINFAYTSLLTGMYNIYGIRGTVTANEYISLYENIETTREGQLRINETAYDAAIPVLSDYLGRYVTAYVRAAQGVEVVVAIITDLGFDKCVEIRGESIAKVENGAIYYYPTAESKRPVTVKYDDPILIYNGVAYNNAENLAGASKIYELVERAASTKRGTVKVITDGNRDVVIIDIVDNAIISSVDKENQIVYVKYVGKDEVVGVSLKKTKTAVYGWAKPVAYVTATQADGVTPVSIDDMVMGRLVSLIVSEDGSVVQLMWNSATASGDITAAETKLDDQFVTISNTRYEVDRDYRKTVELKPGDNSIFLLDVFGRIAGTSKAIVNGTPKPGIICAADAQGTFTRTVYVKLYKDDDTFGVFTLDKKVEFDGDRVDNDEAYTKISNLLADEKVDEKRFILYKTDKDGNINFIDTIALGENEKAEETLNMMGGGKADRSLIRGNSSHLGSGWTSIQEETMPNGQLPATDDTKIFYTPREANGQLGDEDSFIWEITTSRDISSATTSLKNCCLYRVGDSAPFVEYVVSYKIPDPIESPKASLNPDVVNDILLGLDNDGMTVAVLETSRTYTKTTHENKIADQVYLFANGCRMLIKGLDIGKYISAGDAVILSTPNAAGAYTIVELLYDYSEGLALWCWKNIEPTNTRLLFKGWKTDINTFEEYQTWVNGRTDEEYTFKAESTTKDNMPQVGNRRYILCDIEDVWAGVGTIIITGKDEATDYEVVSVKRDAQRYDVFYDENRPWADKVYIGSPLDMLPANACGEGETPDKILILERRGYLTSYIIWKQ